MDEPLNHGSDIKYRQYKLSGSDRKVVLETLLAAMPTMVSWPENELAAFKTQVGSITGIPPSLLVVDDRPESKSAKLVACLTKVYGVETPNPISATVFDSSEWECRCRWTVLEQAVEMGMKIVNNRKRMRKRMRQVRRHWGSYQWVD